MTWVFVIRYWLHFWITVFNSTVLVGSIILRNLIYFQSWAIRNLVLCNFKSFHLNLSWSYMSRVCLSFSEVLAARTVLKRVFLFWALVNLHWLFISLKLFCNLWTDLICLIICKRWFLENWLVDKLFAILGIDLKILFFIKILFI